MSSQSMPPVAVPVWPAVITLPVWSTASAIGKSALWAGPAYGFSQTTTPSLPNVGRKRYVLRSAPSAQLSPRFAAAYREPPGPGTAAVMASSA